MDHDHHHGMGDATVGAAPYPSSEYARILWYVLLACFALGACFCWTLVLLSKFRLRSVHKAKTGLFHTVVSFARDASYLQHRVFGITLPSLGQINLCACYTAVLLSCLLSRVWGPIPVFWEAISMRAAYLSLAQLVLIIALATKKNFIALLFATSHERVNVFHRYVSLCMLVTTTMHMGYFLREWLFYDVWLDQWNMMGKSILIWGFAAWGNLIFINATSVSYIRHRLYTYWLPLHIASMIALVGLIWRHITRASRMWIYVAAGLFVLDRVLRLASRLYVTQGRLIKAGAALEALPGGVTRITLPQQMIPCQRPGQYVFLSLYQLGIHSHPFTITSELDAGQLKFLVKAKHGFTRHVNEHAATELPPSTSLKYSLEGPYGGLHLPPCTFDTVLMVAGGTGASFIVSLLQNLARDSRCCRRVDLVWVVKDVPHLSWFQDELSTSMKRAECQFLDLHVAVYSTGQQEWSAEDIRLLDVFEKDCHCSHAESNNNEKHAPHGSDSSQEITLETTLLPLTQTSTTVRPCDCGAHQPRLQLLKGRPDLRQIVLQHLVQDDRQGETGIFVCGPDGLTRDMRSAVVRASDLLAVKKGSGREAVYLHVENQV